MAELTDTEAIIAAIHLGDEAQAFFDSEPGKYIVSQAEKQALKARLALETVKPWRTRRIRELQNDVKCSRDLLFWIAQMLEYGKSARDQLNEEYTDG